ncbi:MAG: hypothetical protein OER96_08295 [Gammaproteobacteria bacterium]|nr:hypothetical protein [Gammaproteobacteria bacterium]
MTASELIRLNFYVDLNRYPIQDIDSRAGQTLIARCHEMMERDTLCLLEGFLHDEAIAELSAEITQLQSAAHKIDYNSTPYGWMNNAGFPPEHPRSQLPRRHCGVISTDLLNPAGACMELFGFDELTEFIRRLLCYDTLYRSACPTLSVQINVMDEGEQFGWHFDTNDGVVSFTIQNADSGGSFEYVPLIRDEQDENYSGVGRILNDVDTPRRPQMSPGTFSLFLGRRSLHRVAPVGETTCTRQSLLYSYDRKFGMVFPEKTCQRITSKSPEPYFGALTPVD